MFPELRKKLTVVYTVSTGIILSLVLAAAFWFYLSAAERQQESAFQNHLLSLSIRLQSDSHFSDQDLARLEMQNRLIIFIEENGSPLFFSGAYMPATGRSVLIERAEAAARREGISTTAAPISSEILKTSTLHITGDSHDSYLGNVLVVQTAGGYKKLVLLYDETAFVHGLIKTGALYLLIGAAGITLLYLSGRRFVRRALRPAENSYVKQQEFVAAASHELRSPLAVISTSAAAITDAPDQSRSLAETILKECRRGSTLIKDLLLLASADEGTLRIKKREFEIDELLLELLELYEPLFRSKGGFLRLDLPADPLPPVYGDPDLCRQILLIFLDNAAAYGLDTGQPVTISAAPSGSGISVAVRDHGPGLTDTEKALVFDRFYRKDKARAGKEHFGLGLSIAAELAGLQQLKIRVEDTAGGGCTFLLDL